MSRVAEFFVNLWQRIFGWVKSHGVLGFAVLAVASLLVLGAGATVTVAVSRAVSDSLAERERGSQPESDAGKRDETKSTEKPSDGALEDAGGSADQRVNGELAQKLGHEFYTDDPWLKQTTSGVSVEFKPNGAYVKIFLACASASGGARISDGQSLNVPFSCSAAGAASTYTGNYFFSRPAPSSLTVSLWGTKLDGTHSYTIPGSSKPSCQSVVVPSPTTQPTEPAPAPSAPEPTPTESASSSSDPTITPTP